MVDNSNLIQIVGWTADLLIIFCTIPYIRKFRKLEEKTHGQYMIFILCISNLVYPITNIVRFIFLQYGFSDDNFYPITVSSFRFSLFWSAAIAFFSYLILVKKSIVDAQKYIGRALTFCLLATLICPTMIITKTWGLGLKHVAPGLSIIYFPPNNIIFPILGWFLYDIVGTLSPALAILYCYHKIYKELGSQQSMIGFSQATSPKRIFLYVAIPLVCFGPFILADIVFIFRESDFPFWVVFLASTTRRCWGFLNIVAYWFLNPSSTADRTSLEISIIES